MPYDKITDNIYIFRNEEYFEVNIGALVLPSKIIMIDTGISKEEAQEFRDYIEKETNKKCEILYLTHAHGDHVGGLEAFSDCRIIASKLAIKKLKLKKDIPKIEYTDFIEVVDEEIKVIFKQTGGHSEDSSYVYCPNFKVLFAGDNLFRNMYPFGQEESSNPEVWISVFHEYLKLDAEYFIPGHQNVCSKDVIGKYIEFIEHLKNTILELHSKGKSKDEITAHCFSLNPFEDTVEDEGLANLKTRTIENWYKQWTQ